MSVITKEVLAASHTKGEYLQGVLLLRDYTINLTKNGKEYISGTLSSGVDVQFKAWNSSNAFDTLKETSLQGKAVNISGTWDEYNGMFSVILNQVQENPNVDVMDLLPTKYNISAYSEGLKKLIASSISPKALQLAEDTLFGNARIMAMFETEFAARSHHDNVKGGLLAHTYKVCSLAVSVASLYGSLVSSQDEKDLFILGCLFHDIGKIREMHMGVYTKQSIVTHRFLGIEMLNKKAITEAYSEEWYYSLVSILLQHHGDFGDPCKTVLAKMVHMVDMMDSELTLIQQTIEQQPLADSVRLNGNYLTIYGKGDNENEG